jgi:uncharacterized protein (TIGR01619 family)
MSENWDFYPCQVEGEPASIMVNLALIDGAPSETMPVCTWLHVQLLEPDDEGFVSSEEFDRMCEIGDFLEAAIRDAPSAMTYAGRCTSGGRRDYYLYAESGIAAESLLSSVMAAFPEYQFETGFRDDPQWRLYKEFLYPAPRSMQLIRNRRVLDALQQEGDPLTQPRPIRHFTCFKADASTQKFRQILRDEGFEIVGSGIRHGTQIIIFERTDPVELLAISQVTIHLRDLANMHGGEYDGWETEVPRIPADGGSDGINTEGSIDEA